jgi:hypothetical protein
MERPQSVSDAHEEHPDGAKELYERAQSRKGEVVEQEISRKSLLQEHSRHLKFQTEGHLQPRNFILPMPYRPSKISLSHANWTHIKKLRIASREIDEAIVLRTLTEPVVHSSSVTIVEDEHGDVARLTVCNLEDSMNDPVLPKGSVLAIKQPCWGIAPNGGYYIRVDHPSDLVVLVTMDKKVPVSWRERDQAKASKSAVDWKKEGDMMFLKKKFRKALDWCVVNIVAPWDVTDSTTATSMAAVSSLLRPTLQHELTCIASAAASTLYFFDSMMRQKISHKR